MVHHTFGLSISLRLRIDSVKKKEEASPNMEISLAGFWMVEQKRKWRWRSVRRKGGGGDGKNEIEGGRGERKSEGGRGGGSVHV